MFTGRLDRLRYLSFARRLASDLWSSRDGDGRIAWQVRVNRTARGRRSSGHGNCVTLAPYPWPMTPPSHEQAAEASARCRSRRAPARPAAAAAGAGGARAGPRVAADLRGVGADAEVRPGVPPLRVAGGADAPRRAHDRRVPGPGPADGGAGRARGDGHRRRGLSARRLAGDRRGDPARGHAVLDDHRRPRDDRRARARRRGGRAAEREHLARRARGDA